ncbi:nucleotide exchange factor GrpE [Desulfonatronum thioautotrophicum]|uniref:nucleotide exchange factor GrpE n=1 Tax=Desulfonatronum thioautotrophicum TaxID=617001 RepID=UPI0005EB519F|nr:nucleotide exchange factor GrpE [Desulfonatronum thioautotrophicum]
MFSFFKKKPDPLDPIRTELRERIDALEQELKTPLERADEALRKIATQIRRQGVALDMTRESQEQKLDAVHALLAERHDNGQQELLAFAEAFVRYAAHHDRDDESLRQAKNKFSMFLESQGIEIIWDLHEPFDDTRHQVCDIREDPAFPDATILEVVRPGFLIYGRANPPAMVVVNKRTLNSSIFPGEQS